jgi:outer membrane protein
MMFASGSMRPIPIAVVLFAFAPVAAAQTPLTLDQALREARAHNAQLAVAAFDTTFADAGLRAATGRRWPTVGLDGHVHGGTPSKYASGDARLQLVGVMPLYDGGVLSADLGRARADQRVSQSRYRMAQRDLDLDVRLLFGAAGELEDEIALREKGVDRLRRYVDLISARREAGEPVAGDLLKAQVQRDQQAAEIEETRRQHAGVMLELKDILGREPDDDLVLAPLPAPAPPGPGAVEPWETVPDVRAADASQQSASAAVDVARAGRRPHLDLSANVGTEPILGSSFEAPLNTGQGEGAEVILTMSWPLWDRGVYRGELAQARATAEQASHEALATRRAAKLQWYQARTDLTHLYEIVRLREQIVPTAEDAYLQTESLYRGGNATALEVLDAFIEWLQSSLDASRATLDYRNAEARERRWGTP